MKGSEVQQPKTVQKGSQPLVLTKKNLLELIENKKSKTAKTYITELKNKNPKAEKYIKQVLYEVFCDKKVATAGTYLYSLAFYKNLLISAQLDYYEDNQFFPAQIHDSIVAICEFNKSQPNIKVRGAKYFEKGIEIQKKQQTQILENMGVAVVTFALELIQSMAEWYQQDYFTGQESRFLTKYKELKKKGVTFPKKQEYSYIKQQDQKEFESHYNALLEMQEEGQQNVPQKEKHVESPPSTSKFKVQSKQEKPVQPVQKPAEQKTKIEHKSSTQKDQTKLSTKITQSKNLQPQSNKNIPANEPIQKPIELAKKPQNKVNFSINQQAQKITGIFNRNTQAQPNKKDQSKTINQSKTSQLNLIDSVRSKVVNNQEKKPINQQKKQDSLKVVNKQSQKQSLKKSEISANQNENQIKNKIPLSQRQQKPVTQLKQSSILKNQPKILSSISGSLQQNLLQLKNTILQSNDPIQVSKNQQFRISLPQNSKIQKSSLLKNNPLNDLPPNNSVNSTINPNLSKNILPKKSFNKTEKDKKYYQASRVSVNINQTQVVQIPETQKKHKHRIFPSFEKQENESNDKKIVDSGLKLNLDKKNMILNDNLSFSPQFPENKKDSLEKIKKRSLPKTQKKFMEMTFTDNDELSLKLGFSQHFAFKNKDQKAADKIATKTLSSWRVQKQLRRQLTPQKQIKQQLLLNVIQNIKPKTIVLPFVPQYFIPVTLKMSGLRRSALQIFNFTQTSEVFFNNNVIEARLMKPSKHYYILSLLNVSRLPLKISAVDMTGVKYGQRIQLIGNCISKTKKTNLNSGCYLDIKFSFSTSSLNFKFLPFQLQIDERILQLQLPITLLDECQVQNQISVNLISSYQRKNAKLIKSDTFRLNQKDLPSFIKSSKHQNTLQQNLFTHLPNKKPLWSFTLKITPEQTSNQNILNCFITQINSNQKFYQLNIIFDVSIEDTQNFAKVITELLTFLLYE